MMTPSEILAGLFPSCFCGALYDSRQCSPQVLPCAHTLCLMCLSKESQGKKPKCPLCHKKYKKFTLNTALLETIERITLRRDTIENISRRCDDCDQRWPMMQLRRCRTCEDSVFNVSIQSINQSKSVVCLVCLNCAVDRHSGHLLPQIYVRDRPPIRAFTPTMLLNIPPPPTSPPPGLETQKHGTFPFRIRSNASALKRPSLTAHQFSPQFDQMGLNEPSECSSQQTHSPSAEQYSRRPLPTITSQSFMQAHTASYRFK